MGTTASVILIMLSDALLVSVPLLITLLRYSRGFRGAEYGFNYADLQNVRRLARFPRRRLSMFSLRRKRR